MRYNKIGRDKGGYNLKKVFCLIISLFLILSTIGCENEGYKGKTYKVNSNDDFIRALESRNNTVNEIKPAKDEVSQSFFSVNARKISIGGKLVSIYEFNDSNIARTQANTISKDGYGIGNYQISWIDKPHFYQKGNLIVCYVGNDRNLLFELVVILGSPITN